MRLDLVGIIIIPDLEGNRQDQNQSRVWLGGGPQRQLPMMQTSKVHSG